MITGDAGIVYGVPFRLLGCVLHIQFHGMSAWGRVGFDSCVNVKQCSRAFIFHLPVSILSSLGFPKLVGYRLMIRGSYLNL